MKELRDWLKEGDPFAAEPSLCDVDVQRMRQAVVSAGESQQSSFADWARGSWATATVVIALTIAVSMSGWLKPVGQVRSLHTGVAPTLAPPEPVARRQVQMIAPGGTRVIWIFNADFQP
jgi:hypothetical protein